MRQDARDHRDQQRLWLVGIFKHEHIVPLHQDVVSKVQTGFGDMNKALQDAKAELQADIRAALAPNRTLVTSEPPRDGAQVSRPSTSTPSDTAALPEPNMGDILAGLPRQIEQLTLQTAPISNLVDTVASVNDRLRILEPVPAQVQQLGSDFRDLLARVQHLEATRSARDQHDRDNRPGEARSTLVLRGGGELRGTDHENVSSAFSGGPPPLTPPNPSARAVTGQTPRPPSTSSRRAGSSHEHEQPAARLLLPGEGSQQNPGARDRCSRSGVTSRAASAARDARAASTRDETPTPAPRASRLESSATPVAAKAPSPSPPMRARTPADAWMSPLTTDTSPGNVRVASRVNAPAASAEPDAHSSDGDQMETGDDWGAGGATVGAKRGAVDSGDVRPRKRRAAPGAGEDDDEDAEGSVVDSEATAVVSNRPVTRSPGAPTGAIAPAPTPGRRAGLRSRPARSG